MRNETVTELEGSFVSDINSLGGESSHDRSNNSGAIEREEETPA